MDAEPQVHYYKLVQGEGISLAFWPSHKQFWVHSYLLRVFVDVNASNVWNISDLQAILYIQI